MNRFADLVEERPVNRFADLLNEVPPMDLTQLEQIEYDLPQQRQIVDPQSYGGYVGEQAPSEPTLLGRAGTGLYNQLVSESLKPIVTPEMVGEANAKAEQRALRDAGQGTGKFDSDKYFKLLNQYRDEEQAALSNPGKGLRFDIKPAETLGEKATDVGVGLGSFMAKFATFKKIAPSMPDPMIWEAVNQAEGGAPGRGIAMGNTMKAVGALPGKGIIGKTAKTAATGGVFAGMTAIEGGTPEDIATSFLLPFAMRATEIPFKMASAKRQKTIINRMKAEAKANGYSTEGVPDSVYAEILDVATQINFWNGELKKGKITPETHAQRVAQEYQRAQGPFSQFKKTEPASKQEAPAQTGLPQGRTVRTDYVGDVMNALPEQGYVKPARQSVKPDTSIPARGKFVRTADGIMFPDGRKIITPMTPETEAATKDRGYIRNVEKVALDYANGVKGAQAKLKQLLDKRPEFKTQAENAYYDGLLERANNGDAKAVDKLNSLVQRTNLPSYDELLERAQAGDPQAVEAIQTGQYRNESRPAGMQYRRPTKQEVKQQEAEQTISKEVFGRTEPIQEQPNEQMQRQAEAPQVEQESAPVTAGAVPSTQAQSPKKPVSAEKVDTLAGRMSLDEFESKGYMPNEVTREDWVNLMRAHRRSLGQSEQSGTPNAPFADYEEYHRADVERAIKAGEVVEDDVLADYPDLKKPKTKKQDNVDGVAFLLDDGSIIKGTGKASHIDIVNQVPQGKQVVDSGFLDADGQYLMRDSVISPDKNYPFVQPDGTIETATIIEDDYRPESYVDGVKVRLSNGETFGIERKDLLDSVENQFDRHYEYWRMFGKNKGEAEPKLSMASRQPQTPPQQPIGEDQGGKVPQEEDRTVARIARQTQEVNDQYKNLIGTRYTTEQGAEYQITGFNDLGVAYGKRIVDGKPKGKEVVVRGFDPSGQVAQDVQGKEPWQMTRGEFAKTPKAKELFDGKRTSIYSGLGNPSRSAQRRAFEQSISGYHKLDVKEAVKRGDKVPLPVLQEYSSEPWAQEAISKRKQEAKKYADNLKKELSKQESIDKQADAIASKWEKKIGQDGLTRQQAQAEAMKEIKALSYTKPLDTPAPSVDNAGMSKATAARDIAPQTTASGKGEMPTKITDRIDIIEGIEKTYWDGNNGKLTVYYDETIPFETIKVRVVKTITDARLHDSVKTISYLSTEKGSFSPPAAKEGGRAETPKQITSKELESIVSEKIRNAPSFPKLRERAIAFIKSLQGDTRELDDYNKKRVAENDENPERYLSAHAGVMNAKSSRAVKLRELSNAVIKESGLPRKPQGKFRGDDGIDYDKLAAKMGYPIDAGYNKEIGERVYKAKEGGKSTPEKSDAVVFKGNLDKGDTYGNSDIQGNFSRKKDAEALAAKINGKVEGYLDGKHKRGWVVTTEKGTSPETRLPNWIKTGSRAMLGTTHTTTGFKTKAALQKALEGHRGLGEWKLFIEKSASGKRQYVGIIEKPKGDSPAEPVATDAPATRYETDSLPKPLAEGAKNRRREILQARLDRGETAPAKALREFKGEAWADEAIAKTQERPAYGTPEHKEYIDKAVEKYDSDHSETGIINADTARRALAGYDPADIANEAKYFGDAAEITDRVFDKWLKDKKGAGDDTVLFTAGGTGSGKSTAAQNMKDRPVITLDTTLSSRDYAESLIDKALKAGFTPEILYVYRDPVDAWENGVWPRWESEGGHFVSADNHLDTHKSARDTILALAKKYGNRINIVIKENKSGKSPSTLSLAQLKKKPYNEAELREKINAISKEKVKANRSLEGRAEIFAGQGRTAGAGESVNPVSQPQEVASQIKQSAPKVTDAEYNPPRDMYDNPTAEQVEAMKTALENAKNLPISVSPKDLNAKKIHDAFRNTSWTPDQKPSLYQREYINDMVKTYESLSKLAKSERQKAVLAEEMEAYRKGYIEKLNTFLDSHSRVASSAITGPAKFPTRANQKRGDAADKRRDEWIEWDKRATKAIEKKINDIAVDEAGGQIGMLEKKIAVAEKLQQAMRDANKIVRSKTLSDSQKIEQIEAMGIKGAGELLKPDYMGRVGFADFEMTNNLAGIKRMKARLEDLKAREAATGEDFVMEARGVKVVDNKDAERVQIVFDTKPDADTIQKLKRRGFRWSRSNNAWQRKNTAQGIKDARQIVESLQGPKSSGGPTPNRKEAGFVRIPQAEDVTRSAKEAKQAVVKLSRKMARKAGLKRKLKDFARDPLSIPKDIGDGVLYATAPVDFELEKISPKLSQGIRDHAYDVVDGTQDRMLELEGMFNAEYKMTADDMDAFEEAWFRADFDTIGKIGEKYGFSKDEIRRHYDTYYDREIEVGINTRYRNNFLPQRVRDMDGLVKFLSGKENRDVIEDFITKFREKNNRRPTEREIIDGVNSMMQGYPASGVRIYQPGISKTRKIPYVYKEIRDFYYTPFETARFYIENAEEAIATRKFFGKVSKEYGKLRKAEAKYRQKAETLAAQGDTEGADKAWNTAESIVREIRERGYAMTADDVIDDNSVGAMLAEMFDSGELKRGDSKKVQGLLQAYFNSKRANKFARTWLSLNYLTKLGNSMLHNVTQLSEIGNPLAEDFRTAIQESLKALVNAGEINKYNAPYIRHIGDEIGEFSVDKLTGMFLQLTMWIDRPLKFATVNTAINKARREAQRKAVAAPFVDRLKTYFGDDWQNALNDLRSGELTDRVKRYGYYRLSDVQPVTRAQSSQAALNSPGMIKPLLQMKNFSLRQIYRIVNDARREIKAGRVKRGIGIFLGTAALLLSLQAGTDVIKDLIRGRKLKEADEYILDRALNNLFTSRYDLASLEYSNPSDVIAKSLAPSIPIVDDVFFAWRKDSAYPLYRMVPLVGQKMADIAMPDSQKLKSAYPEPDDWKSDQYKGIYRALDNDDTQKAQKYYAELKKKGISNSDILQSIKSRSAVRVPKKDREQWLAGLSKKYRAMYEREMERQKSLEVKFYGLLSDSDLRKELAKSMTTPTQNNGWVQRARKGQEEKVKMLMAELKRRKEAG